MSDSADISAELALAKEAASLCREVERDPSDDNLRRSAVDCISRLLGISSNIDIRQYGQTARACLWNIGKFKSFAKREKEARMAHEYAQRLPEVRRFRGD